MNIELITERLTMADWTQKKKAIPARFNDNTPFIRKGYVTQKAEVDVKERSRVVQVTTGGVDRDNEIVRPDGVMLEQYLMNPVVLFGHDYHSIPVGKCEWIKRNTKGLFAKTVYNKTALAQEIYALAVDGFPLAVSIGFVPLEYINRGNPEFQKEIDDCIKNGWVTKDAAESVRCIYTKVLLLEYSDVPVPSNPEALQIAVSKGWVKPETAAKNLTEKEKKEMTLEEARRIVKEAEKTENIKDHRITAEGVKCFKDAMEASKSALAGCEDMSSGMAEHGKGHKALLDAAVKAYKEVLDTAKEESTKSKKETPLIEKIDAAHKCVMKCVESHTEGTATHKDVMEAVLDTIETVSDNLEEALSEMSELETAADGEKSIIKGYLTVAHKDALKAVHKNLKAGAKALKTVIDHHEPDGDEEPGDGYGDNDGDEPDNKPNYGGSGDDKGLTAEQLKDVVAASLNTAIAKAANDASNEIKTMVARATGKHIELN